MRPADIKREIERLTIDAALARSQLGSLKAKLGEVQSMVADLRAALAPERSAAAPADSTSRDQAAQAESDRAS